MKKFNEELKEKKEIEINLEEYFEIENLLYFRVMRFDDEALYFEAFDKNYDVVDILKITYIHDQDCCENVYAQFKALEDTGFKYCSFKNLKIKIVEDCGIKLEDYFIPCYNEQNGYYSDELILVIEYDRKQIKLDITDANIDIDQ